MTDQKRDESRDTPWKRRVLVLTPSEASQKFSIERGVLDDVKEWASETIDEFRLQVEKLEKERNHLAFYLGRAGSDILSLRREISELRKLSCDTGKVE